ncbi:hypothetical protein AB3Y40_02165 [Yoonia sp. R2331]
MSDLNGLIARQGDGDALITCNATNAAGPWYGLDGFMALWTDFRKART